MHFTSALSPGERATVEVWPNGVGLLDAWIDFNADGDWDDSGEKIISTQPLSTGRNRLYFTVPGSATLGTTMARFRFSMTPGLGVTGVAEVGEVEDYVVEISSVSIEPIQTLTATAYRTWVELEWLNSYIGFDWTMVRYRTDGYPTGPLDGTMIDLSPTTGPGLKDSYLHSGLSPGTTYYYAVYVGDGNGGYSTGRLVSARPQNSVHEVSWVYSTSASALAPVAPLPGEAYYAVSNDRRLHAMEAGQSGGSWPSFWTPPAMNGPAQGRGPVVVLPDSTVFGVSHVALVGSQDGHVYVFDAERGTRLWISSALEGQVQAAPAAMFTDFGAPFSLVVAATRNSAGDSKIYGLDPHSGSILWSFDNGGGTSGIGIISSQPSIDRSGPVPRVVFASRQHPTGSSDTVWGLDLTPTSASLAWSVDIGDVDGSAIRWGDYLYVGTNAGEIHALDPESGAAVWPAYATADGPVKGWVWVDSNASRMYFSTTTSVHAVTENGPGVSPTPFWSPPLSVSSPSCPLIIDGTLYIGAADDTVFAIDSLSASPTPVPLVVGDPTVDKTLGSPSYDIGSSHLVLGSDQGRVFAVSIPFGGAP